MKTLLTCGVSHNSAWENLVGFPVQTTFIRDAALVRFCVVSGPC